tara:strand:+ start:182 stop:703 length:522 start_codon:yes stop_codon:yes gene_type:complete
MVEKIKINDYGDCVYSEDAVIELIYQNPKLDISKIFTEVDQYNSALEELDIDLPKLPALETKTEDLQLFDKNNYEQWYMPKKYENINVLQWLLDKCQTDAEKLRVQEEYSRYQEKNFIKVLQFLIYFVDTLRANNIVWGVGRGSSVASFCLFLIGVHKINPMLYNLDYTEFLR